MKKLIILFFLFFSCFSGVNANWSSYTPINGDNEFIKQHGVHELNVFEDYIINPFNNSTIVENKVVCSGNNCPCGASGCEYISNYSVDGRVFNTSHPKYKSFGETRKGTTQQEPGISYRIVYRENTYSNINGITVPNQQVTVRKYYSAQFKHDTTYPTCGEVRYYDDAELTRPFTYNGGWLNEPKYYTMVCQDSQTGCKCEPDDENCIIRNGEVISAPQLLGHKVQPTVSFINRVALNDTACTPGGSFPEVLYDLKTPKVDLSFGGDVLPLNIETKRKYDITAGKKLDALETPGVLSYTLSGGIDRLAGGKDFLLSVEDVYLDTSVHGVSGLKTFNYKVFRNTNQTHTPISRVDLASCSGTRNYPQYNTDGSIETTDYREQSFSCPEIQKSGKYTIVIYAEDWAGNKTTVKIPVSIYPNEVRIAQSSIVSQGASGTQYANNSDVYDYKVTLRDAYSNPIYNKAFGTITQSIQSYSGGNEILLSDNSDALKITPSGAITTDNQGSFQFKVSSLKPGNFTERFSISYDFWNEKYTQNLPAKSFYITNNGENTFKKPFSATITMTGPGTNIELGTLQNYKIDIMNEGSISGLSNGRLNLTQSSVGFSSPHYFDVFSNVDNIFSLADPVCSFDGQINTSSSAGALDAPEIDVDNMEIRYRIGGKNVSYILDEFSIAGCDVSTLGLKITGNIQGNGKSEITGQTENFSDLSTSELRNSIRKNAYNLIGGMTSGQIVNNVRYVEGNVTLGGEISGYETVVVKNGNVFITSNLNMSEKTLGIIVLKDTGYSLESDYNTSGNIYIANNVTQIHAALYADGALRSARSNGTSYSDSVLGTKLRLKGVLFSKNTVGGAVAAGGDLLLPGGGITTDVLLAKIYDLNYVRRAQTCGDDYSFLIEYNPKIQSNPPKGFSF